MQRAPEATRRDAPKVADETPPRVDGERRARRPAVAPTGSLRSGGSRAWVARLVEGRRWGLVCAGTDAVLLFAGALAALLGAPAAGVSPDRATIWLLPLLAIALLASRGGYRPRLDVRLFDRIVEVVAAIALAAMTLIAVDNLLDPDSPGVGLLVRAWLFGTVYVVGGRVLLGGAKQRAQANRLVGRPTLIVGSGQIGALVERRLRAQPELGLIPIGYLDAEPAPPEFVPGRRAPILGEPSELAEIAEATGARHVIFSFLSTPDQALIPLVRVCEQRGLEMSLVPRLFDSVSARVDLEHIGGLPLYGLRRANPHGWEFAVKHLLGKAIAGVLLLLLSPLMLAIGLLVRLTSPGPALLRQTRIGRDGRQFEFLKFRSLRQHDEPAPRGDREESEDKRASYEQFAGGDLRPGWAELGLRPTPIGGFLRRACLDELPQLWNVVKGDMDLVGPRPEEPQFVELFGPSVRRYDDRHRVKSGVTGWAQIHGLRGTTSLADRIDLDNYYIENWSLRLDLKILLMTLVVPFRRSE